MADFESRLSAARVAYEQNNPREALKRLDRARRAALKRRDEAGLQRVLEFAEGTIPRDERTEIERESLLYSVRQNLRQLTRRRALMAGGEWADPFPTLESPRSHTRTYISPGLKVWIAIGVLLATLLFVAWIVDAIVSG